MARRSRPRAAGAANARPVTDLAATEQLKQVLEQLKAMADIQSTATSHSKDSLSMLGRIETQLEQLGTGGGGVGSAVSFFGGTYSSGPNGGRPVMSPNQTVRPTMGPGGYPGGHGYGMQGTNFGYGAGAMGGMGGIFGAAQAGAARMVHNQFGLGDTSWYQNRDGSWTSETGETISDAVYQRRAKVSRASGRAGGAHGILGTLRGAISELPLAGRIGVGALTGAETLYHFGNWIGSQRAANAQYQSIYGPGTSGFDQRMQNFGGRFRNWARNIGSALGIGDGGLSDADYDKTFKAVSAMGFQGADRNNMIGFARGNFNSLGMSVDESLQVIGINAKEAASNFQTLHESLKQVSQMAQQAGQSADVFRQKFIQSYGNAVGAGFAGSSAAIAQAQVSATAGQGRLFTGLDTSAMYSSMGAQQVLASTMGYGSVLDFALATQHNPQVLAQAQDKRLDQVFASVVPADVQALVKDAIAKNGGAQNVATNQNAAQSVVNMVEQQRPGALNSWALVQALQAVGIQGAQNLDPVAAAIYYVQWVAKNGTTFGTPVAKSMAAHDQRRGGSAASSITKSYFGSMTNQRLGVGTQNGQPVFDPVIGQMQAAHITMVQVQTANGQSLVSLETAAKDYRDQLTKGTAVIASGPNAGQTVGTIFGTEQSAQYQDTTHSKAYRGIIDAKVWGKIKGLGLTDTQLETLGSLSKMGFGMGSDSNLVSLAQQMATQDTTGGGGTITVDLSDAAKKYLNITTTGDSLVNTAAASGGPPQLSSTGSSTGH